MQHESQTTPKRPRNVALALEYPIDLQGGVSVIVRALVRELAPHYRLSLVSPDTAEQAAASTVADCIAEHIHWEPRQTGVRSAVLLSNRLVELHTDIAHFHFGGNFGWGSRTIGCTPLPYSARRGISVFSTVHSVVNLLTGYCGPQKPALVKLSLLPMAWIGKMHLLNHVTREISASKHDYDLLCKWYRPLRHKFAQIYHSQIADGDAPELESREKLIINVGHLATRKGQAVLVDAFGRIAARHPHWRLALIGPVVENAAEREIRQLVEAYSLGDRVQMAGSLADPSWEMKRASIYVQPSFEEALGLALQEAMYFGCACIGTSVGGIPELIEPGTGFLVPPGDPAALAEQLEVLINDSAARERVGRAAAVSIRKRGMTRAAMTARHVSMYDAFRK